MFRLQLSYGGGSSVLLLQFRMFLEQVNLIYVSPVGPISFLYHDLKVLIDRANRVNAEELPSLLELQAYSGPKLELDAIFRKKQVNQ